MPKEKEQFVPLQLESTIAKINELNEYAVKKMKYLTDHSYFITIRTTDTDMANNRDPFSKGFYLSKQDKISEAYGEILIAYRSLKRKWLLYLASRKLECAIQAKTENSKLPGNDILEDMISAEITEVYSGLLILKGWVARGENSIKTARNHTYGEREREEGGTHNNSDNEPKD